jgi:drug/metabolite transporter (DMT)-like permease
MASGHMGEVAALATACCWVVTSIAFARAGQRIGSLSVNMIRLSMALPLLCLTTWILRGTPWPTDASSEAWGWLSISGIIGFVFGDMCLFRAFLLIGPRLSSLIMATSPLMAAVIGYGVLGETLGPLALLGMFLTIAGVAWAVADRSGVASESQHRGIGVLLAVGGALGQAAGLVLSKLGMGDYDPFAATQIRVLAAIGGWLLVFALTWRWRVLAAGLRDRRAMAAVSFGALFGPVLGVGLSLVAVQHANTGVAASIMSTTPILIIPVTVIVYRERVGLGGVLGAVIAVAGVVVLFVR